MTRFVLCCLTTLLCGCTSTYLRIGDMEARRVSCGQKVYVEAGYDSNRLPYIIYDNEGGAEVAGRVTEGAVRGLKK